jgi:hypothetical protein
MQTLYTMQTIRPALVLAALALATPAAAQLPASPQSLGMGGAHMGVARGQEALLLNPAQLGLHGTPHWSVAMPQVVLGGTLVGIRFGDIGDIRNYNRLTPEEARAILDRAPASGTVLEYDLTAPVAAFSAGRFAFGATYHTSGRQGLAYDLGELFLLGYEPGRVDFDVRDTQADRIGYWSFSAAHGRRVGPVAVGVTGHLYRGGTLVRSRLLDVEADGQDYSVTYVSLRSVGGTGYGVDVGVAADPVPGLTISAALGNVFGEMDWTEELRERQATLTRGDVEARLFEGRMTDFRESDRPYEGSANPLVQEMEGEVFARAELPRTLRLAAAFMAAPRTEVMGAYQETLNDTRLSGPWGRRVSMGVQHRISQFRLRAGAASNLDEGSLLSGGVAIGPAHLGLGRLRGAPVDGAATAGWVFSFGLATRSNSEVR